MKGKLMLVHSTRLIRRALAAGIFILCGLRAGNAKILTVGQPGTPCPGAQYGTISAAIHAAAPHDVIAICPALYNEQLTITEPLTLRGVRVNGISRVLVQPAVLSTISGVAAVITVMDAADVVIENLAIDAGDNSVTGCTPGLAAVHYLNASGTLRGNAIFGAKLQDAQSCTEFFGNGFGVLLETDGAAPGPFCVWVTHNSIHDFTRNGIEAQGTGLNARIEDNSIAGPGPASGSLQFGVYILNGAIGEVRRNSINEGTCGSLSVDSCINLRSEGVALRAAGDGTIVEQNTITNAQSGIFINGGSHTHISRNLIRNIDALDAIDIQGTITGAFSDSIIEGNTIVNTTLPAFSCGIAEAPGTGVAGNRIVGNTVSDAYCGVAFVSTDRVEGNKYLNTLYDTIDAEQTPVPPPATEP
jgi:nitrous oxidase accessory protein NosD